MLSEEIKEALRKAGREDLILVEEINQSGYAGIMPETGTIVDRRKFPFAIPVQKNILLGIPEPKEVIDLPKLQFFENDHIVFRPQDVASKNCKHRIIVKEVDGIKHRFCEKCNMVAHQDGDFSYGCGFDWCKCQE